MFHVCLFLPILLPSLTSAIFFDVKRYAAEPKDGNEPYRPINYFVNKHKKRSICLFMFCWKHHGNCRSSLDCCECKCKNSSTYFSDPLGCKEGHDMTRLTSNVGKACYFATMKFGFDYVPVFHNQSRFIDVELDLPRRNFQLNDEKTICKVGAIHDHDYHGHKLLFDRNRCSDIFRVYQKQRKQYLHFHSSNMSIWNSFRGRLLSLDIDCYSKRLAQSFSSCFLFQVEGKYREEVDRDPPPEIPDGYACPTGKDFKMINLPLTIAEPTTLASTTTSEISLSIQSSNMTTIATTTILKSTPSSTTLRDTTSENIISHTTLIHTSMHTSKFPTTTLYSTTFPPMTKQQNHLKTTSKLIRKQPDILKTTTNVMKEQVGSPKSTKETVIYLDAKDTMTGTTIGVLTGLGTGLAIVMVCVIIWILIKKRKDIFKLQSPGNTPIYNPETIAFDDHQGYHYDVPNTTVQPMGVIPECGLPNGHNSFNFVPIDDDLSSSGYSRQYSYIGEKVEDMEEPDFESRENAILLKNRGSSKRSSDMSMRPLPENMPYSRQRSCVSERVDIDEQDFDCRENSIQRQNSSKRSSDMSKRPLPENIGYNRQYSHIGERVGMDEPDFGSEENTIPFKSRGGSNRSSDMSMRPLPENIPYSRQRSCVSERVDIDEQDFDCRENTIQRQRSSDMSKRPLPENIGYNRQYSRIGERVELDEPDFESRENTLPLKNRGGSTRSGDMSKRPLPEKPMESGNPYYSVASLGSEKSDKASEGNDLYSLYSTIDDLKES